MLHVALHIIAFITFYILYYILDIFSLSLSEGC